MSIAYLFVCDGCAHEIKVWDDGNPYYIDDEGAKHHAWHPDHEALERCIGNDTPHLCLQCANEFDVDSRAVRTDCPSCRSTNIVDTRRLEGCPCPWCKAGRMLAAPGYYAIS